MKSGICGRTRYFEFSLLIAVALGLFSFRGDAIPAGQQSTPKPQELQVRIEDQQRILRDLRDQIDQQANVAESARETAVGAGALGDAASVFIDESVREQKKLDELKKELAPRIAQAEQALAALQAQQVALSAQVGPKSRPVQAARQRASARKKPVPASGALLQTRQ